MRILSRPRDVREPSLPYSPKQLTAQDVPVQRLVLVLPIAEQSELLSPSPKSTVPAASSPNLLDPTASHTAVPADSQALNAVQSAVYADTQDAVGLIDLSSDAIWPKFEGDNQYLDWSDLK